MIFMRKLHKWLGLLLAAQVLVWIVTGALISLIDMDVVSGRVNRVQSVEHPALGGKGKMAEFSQLELSDARVLSVRLESLLDDPVYRVTTESGPKLLDAYSGRLLEINQTLARRIGMATYGGSGQLLGTIFLAGGSPEMRAAKGPLWRLDFDDEFATRIYLSASDGRVLAHRNSHWKLVDFLLMLHFMDYVRADSFNNPQIIILAFGTLWLAISGVLLVLTSFSRADLQWLPGFAAGAALVDVTSSSPTHSPEIIRLDSRLSLYTSLSRNGINLPSNCDGAGSCGMCRIHFDGPAPDSTDLERAWIDNSALERGERLACQHRPRLGDRLVLPDSAYQTSLQGAVVISARWLTPFLKEIQIYPDDPVAFRPGEYLLFHIPPCNICIADLDFPVGFIESCGDVLIPEKWKYDEERFRAYSLASAPGREKSLTFTIRFSPSPPGNSEAPPGMGSSYLCSRSVGDRLEFRGPAGEFHLVDSEKEKILIGGGAGMAPLRSMAEHLLETEKWRGKLRFWYGARNQDEILYRINFEELAEKYNNFEWGVALSDVAVDSSWQGERGFIHQVVHEHVLQHHESLDNCEFYLCGPPLMLEATRHMLRELGVRENAIRFDDFG